MKRTILFSLLLALPLGMAAKSEFCCPSVSKVETDVPRQEQTPTLRRQAELDKLLSNMVYVSGGTFTMGATPEHGGDAEADEKPMHSVTLSSFYLCKYEVTQALWQAMMGKNPSDFKGADLPVERVSWKDAQTFISRLNRLTGKTFRLPTEAEWEYAARGGHLSRGYKYSGSNNLTDVAWYEANSGRTTHPVGSKSPNELGLYDMSGNVTEWCLDRWGSYDTPSLTNPTGPSKGTSHVIRGGSWYDGAKNCRSTYRDGCMPNGRGDYLGLRLALSQL